MSKVGLHRLLIFLFGSFALGGSCAWYLLKIPSCQELQSELKSRINAYASLHLPHPALEVSISGSCSQSLWPVALVWRVKNLLWRLEQRPEAPLSEVDLRRGLIGDILNHPDLGVLHFVVKFESSLNSEVRLQLENILIHYLQLASGRHYLEFRQGRGLLNQENKAGVSSDSKRRADFVVWRDWLRLWWASIPNQLIKGSQAFKENGVGLGLLLVILFCFIFSLGYGLKFFKIWSPLGRKQKDLVPKANRGFDTLLFAPRFNREMSERMNKLWPLLERLDAKKARNLVQKWWQSDRAALFCLLPRLDHEVQKALVDALAVEQIMLLAKLFAGPKPSSRESHRFLLRLVLDLARELASCSQLESAPLYLHLMTREEWRRVSSQLTRPRRRLLASHLDHERSSWLKVRQDLEPEMSLTMPPEAGALEQILQRVKTVLQFEADQLREQLRSDPQFLQAIDSFFADLTLDTSFSAELAMLILSHCFAAKSGMGRMLECRSPVLKLALKACDAEQIALLAYEVDPTWQQGLWANLGVQGPAVAAAYAALQQDKSHAKSLRLKARTLQRYIEQQILVAEIFCCS